METASLHDGILNPKRFGIRAHRLSQAVSAGAQVPPALVIENAVDAANDFGKIDSAISDYLKPDQLYTLRASPGKADWGGPHTFLSLGMNDANFERIARKKRELTAYELYRQAIATFGIAVHGIDGEPFEALEQQFGSYSADGSIEKANKLLEHTRALYKDEVGEDFPQDPKAQLAGALNSMARQWQAPTARILRVAKGAPENSNLALILQHMVHGLGRKNGVGRLQSVDRKTGAQDYNGIFVPATLSASGANPNRQWKIQKTEEGPSLQQFDEKAFNSLKTQMTAISKIIQDAPEVKFVIDNHQIWITEVLIARREARANLQILIDLKKSKIISKETALLRIDPNSISSYLHPQIDPDSPRDIIASGVAASPGAATGKIVFSADQAVTAQAQGQDAILVRQETSPEDIRGMHAARAILTIRGGVTSHAAVIARGIGLPCVVGASELRVNYESGKILTKNGDEISVGDIITIDGNNGDVMRGSPQKNEALFEDQLDLILKWSNETRRMRVRANADTPDDARRAIRFGADGIGLCRTEHMFFAKDRLKNMRRMILAENEEERRQYLDSLEHGQTADFIELFEIMKGLPVTIRLLDPPLHEFLPKSRDEIDEVAKSLDVGPKVLARRLRELEEFNPMLGLRGVRLGLTLPEIYEMQSRAIFRAASEVNRSAQKPVVPEIMIPLVSAVREVEVVKSRIEAVANATRAENHAPLPYRLGVMVETPRAALRAGEIAENVEFLSMGTNDLTQMTYGLSRDDAGRFMRAYVNNGVFHEDPFLTLDVEGVGELIQEAIQRGRKANKELLIGLCGEHGGDPKSVRYCEMHDFDYVSCSAYRIPVAQIASAQAAISQRKQ